MKATIPYIQHKFEEFNQQYFAGKLSKLPIELSNAKTFLGACVFKRRNNQHGDTEYYDFRLRINTRIDLPEEIVEDTILHEMIHYFIGVNHLEDASDHGPVFQHIMKSINDRYERHINISHHESEEQSQQAYDNRSHWHVIAVVSFDNGRKGIKVLPRVIPKILSYYNKIITLKGVLRIDLFMSNNVYFNRFPSSTALNLFFLDKDEIEQNLKNAEKMKCDGQKVTMGI